VEHDEPLRAEVANAHGSRIGIPARRHKWPGKCGVGVLGGP
jgi:hypothetical protein